MPPDASVVRGLRSLDRDGWVTWRLNVGECTCKSIPLLITVARCPDAFVLPGLHSLDRDGWVTWRLNVGECTCKIILLFVSVASPS